MGRTAKLTVSLPKELVSLADEVAREKKISRSRVVSECLGELAARRKAEEMAAGYLAMAAENERFAAMAAGTAHEVLPEWDK